MPIFSSVKACSLRKEYIKEQNESLSKPVHFGKNILKNKTKACQSLFTSESESGVTLTEYSKIIKSVNLSVEVYPASPKTFTFLGLKGDNRKILICG